MKPQSHDPSALPALIKRSTLRRVTFGILIVGVTYWFFDLIQPFLMPVFWAVVLALVFQPIYNALLARLPNRKGFVATLTTLLITLVVLLPLALVLVAVINQTIGLVDKVNSGEIDTTAPIAWVEERLPLVRQQAEAIGVDFTEIRSNVSDGAAQAGQWVANRALAITQNFLGIAVSFFLMLYFLWFFLYDGRKIVDYIIRALPLGDADERKLLERFALVSRATLKGTAIVALIQGSMGGILFWAIGIEGALFWGVMMTLLSLLPVGGSALVWAPAAIIFAVQGAYGKAIIIVAFGGLAIGLVDNLLRPLLVGRDTKMPDYLVLIATLGGIASFGLAGFVIGPVVAALFLTIWEMVMRAFEENPVHRGEIEEV